MADGVSVDLSEINRLVADLDNVMKVVPEKIAEHVADTAKKIQADWQEPLKGSATVPGGAASITWDIHGVASALQMRSAISAEIGPVLRGQGAVVGMLEYGTPNTGPRGYGAAALQKNEAGFIEGIEKIAGDIL